MSEITDARGVVIEPGDRVIYGFGVGRSVAMAEGVVVGEEGCVYRMTDCNVPDCSMTLVSLTPTGKVRVRVVRRSYSSGEKPVVAINPDRLVTLKPVIPRDAVGDVYVPALPLSPKPTQAEEAREHIQFRIDRYLEDLRSDKITWGLNSFADLAEFHAWAAKGLAEQRAKLKAIDDAEG